MDLKATILAAIDQYEAEMAYTIGGLRQQLTAQTAEAEAANQRAILAESAATDLRVEVKALKDEIAALKANPTTPPVVTPPVVPTVPVSTWPTIAGTKPVGTFTSRTASQVEADLAAGKRHFQYLQITGQVDANGYKGVTFSRCILDAGGASRCLRCDDNSTNPADRVLVNCELRNCKDEAIYGEGFTAEACYIHDSGADGMKPKSYSIVKGCYFHKLGKDPLSHADGVQVANSSNVQIVGNNFDLASDAKQNICIFCHTFNAKPPRNILIEGNRCAGSNGPGAIHCHDSDQPSTVKSTVKTGINAQTGAVVTGNKWDDGSACNAGANGTRA
jgi:hypothetical protein